MSKKIYRDYQSGNIEQFDCRRYIKAGDRIAFDSYKECFSTDQVDRHSATIGADGKVVEVYKSFVIVRLRRGVLESVSRWNIHKVNGHSLGNKAGCFSNLKPIGVCNELCG